MSKREDIPDRLIYTCNCGWIDLGHLRSVENPRNKYASASYLWKDILDERGLSVGNKTDYHLVMYRQVMRKAGLSREFSKIYFIRRGLSLNAKRSVALSIFKEVSLGFEDVQASLSLVTNSGFSEEDLVSNLIGFYLAVHGGNLDWQTLCRPVSKDASLKVWDSDGEVGLHKNRAFLPNFHACSECQSKHKITHPNFPTLFNSIQPAQKGIDFFEPQAGDLPIPLHLGSSLFN